MKKRLLVIGIQEENLFHLTKQLEYIFESLITIKCITLKEIQSDSIFPSDVVLLAGSETQGLIKPFLPAESVCIVAERTENTANLKQLFYLESKKNLLVINDNENSTAETVDSLKQIAPGHNYSGYSGHQPIPKNIDFIVTPGETNLIPKGFTDIIDIGPRVISIETLSSIKKYFHFQLNNELLIQRYIKAMILLANDGIKYDPTSSISDQNLNRTFSQLSTKSALMKSTLEIAAKIAQTSTIVHVQGEAGTGKQMIAEMIHNESSYSHLPFYVYNCSDSESSSIQEELFGSTDGRIKGVIDYTTGGTLYVKNMERLPYSLQEDLLEFIKFNTNRKKIRIITATIPNLDELQKNGIIHTAIYSYASSCILKIPSLSERKEDIKYLIERFKTHFNKKELSFSEEAIQAFYQYQWPGNIRELYNVISYCVCLDSMYITPDSLPLYFRGNQEKRDAESLTEADAEYIVSQIEVHGFLSESIRLLSLYKEGKSKHKSYGRRKMKELLLQENYPLTDQQLRLRIEVLNKHGLLNVQKGRRGTTISSKGETFLELLDG
ncbi:sigma 54-interacting transcriptional regulator [Virgibacillus sp. C22-A2]|uniref:Sigma 54-interacting transcriptional regulator n=1 Tax=Virgibacillus tibetensis TaxID=3042313 RepID=A0ABU6KEN4_9BACI|nr:sigma 54-interacting transcriptional regulator [Virgibacillus sp. C22-A2]